MAMPVQQLLRATPLQKGLQRALKVPMAGGAQPHRRQVGQVRAPRDLRMRSDASP